MRKVFWLVLFPSIAALAISCNRAPATEEARFAENAQVLYRAITDRASNRQVEGEGVVIKLLPDDREGDRHQKFIVRLRAGQTLLIAHNIDQAPRVASLEEGDNVAFSGEYEWNERGGVIHWTHQDATGRHQPGWLKHKGRTYQ
ncbi:MAG: DUF3465 domain-containing protein [Acidobacteriota bacterium]